MFPSAITSCNYVTYRDTSMGCILKRYAAHLLKTHTRVLFSLRPSKPLFPPFYVFLYLQELFFNNESLSRRAAGEKTRKYCSLVHFFRSQKSKSRQNHLATIFPNHNKKNKKKTFDWGSIFRLRQSIYCKCLYLHCWNAINTLKGFSFLQPNKNTGGLSLVGIVQSFVISAVPPLICNSFAPSGRCVRPIVLVELCMQKATPTESFMSW